MTSTEKYRILRELGVGGMGKVYRGLVVGQAGFQRPVVIKRLRQEGDPDHLRLFVEEARRYALLDHENIGRIFDFETVDGQLAIILEFVDGWTLAELLDRYQERGAPPDAELSVFIVSRVCRALQYVFERAAIVHRDISPSNIMMTREGTVKLIDFGIATRSGTSDGCLSGKPAYMAPEMVTDLKADHRSDLFSLGIVLYEMLTLQRLFDGPTTDAVLAKVIAAQYPPPRAHNPAITDDVMALLRRALQRDPERRFASAGDMGVAAEHVLYDKGYGPTNLTLKHELLQLFPEGAGPEPPPEPPAFPYIEATLLPISDGLRETTRAVPRKGDTLVSRRPPENGELPGPANGLPQRPK